jgi:hypothetical protein
MPTYDRGAPASPLLGVPEAPSDNEVLPPLHHRSHTASPSLVGGEAFLNATTSSGTALSGTAIAIRTAARKKASAHAAATGGIDVAPGAMHLATYFKQTKQRLTQLQRTSMTLDQLLDKLPGVKNDPRFPSFTDQVGERARHAANVAKQLGRQTSEFPPLVFAPGGVMDALEELIEELERELARSKYESMKGREVPVCEAFLRGECPRGVTCPFSHVMESVQSWVSQWLRKAVYVSSATVQVTAQQQAAITSGVSMQLSMVASTSPVLMSTSGAASMSTAAAADHLASPTSAKVKVATLTTATVALGQETWAVIVDILRSSKWTESKPAVSRIVARKVTKSAMVVLCPMLQHNWLSSLAVLDLSKSALPPKSVMKLASALPSNTSLMELNLSHCQLGLGGALVILRAAAAGVRAGANPVSAMAMATAPVSRLIALNLASNGIDPADPAFPHFCAAFVEAASRLEKISLADNSLGADGVKRLCRGLMERFPMNQTHRTSYFSLFPRTLRFMNLACNRLGDHGFTAIADLIQSTSIGRDLLFVDLSWNKAGVDGIAALCNAVINSSAVRETQSPTNAAITGAASSHSTTPANDNEGLGVDSSGIKALTINTRMDEPDETPVGRALPRSPNASMSQSPTALPASTQLQALRLQYNLNFGRKGALSLAQMIKSNTTITSVDMRWTSLSDEGGLTINEALMNNKSILDLGVVGNDFEQRTLDSIASRLRNRNKNGLPEGVITAGECVW